VEEEEGEGVEPWMDAAQPYDREVPAEQEALRTCPAADRDNMTAHVRVGDRDVA